jgi:WD40 repeat protein
MTQGDLTGTVIKSYELKDLIGEGGFGAVYRADQQFVGREVAIKIILPQYANRPDFIRRFETEAQLIARLEHPHIVPLYDYWREPDGAYLVMRWLRGGSVQDFIERHGKWELQAASQLLQQIAEALAVAHRQGIIHRDLKPENILLDEIGNAYLSDFGIAKDLSGTTSITQNNAIVGSPAYVSPEQIRGETVTAQADIYALGIVLYEMLTGQRPYQDLTPVTLLYKHLTEPLPELGAETNIPAALNAVFQRATAKDPEARYQDVIELARAFHRAITTDHNGTAVITPSGKLQLPAPENPYKGLRAFQQADSADFFGREALVEKIRHRLTEPDQTARFLAMVGPSGCGKSSVVKAGVIPMLRQGAIPGSENWFIVEMVPGTNPLEELEAALLRIAVNPPESLLSQLREDHRGLLRAVKRVLPDDTAELVLVIDQFEEIFTLLVKEDERAHLLDSLIAAVDNPRSQLRIIITLRADFYDRPLNYSHFGDLMRQRTEIVLPLSTEELEHAITGPAARVGLHLEQGLVTGIVSDISEQPGALPLLQYALTELFERRDGYRLTLNAYHEIGGTMGALAQRADELYDSLSQREQEITRQLFLRLITLGEGTEDTRRRVFLAELLAVDDDPDTVAKIVDAFGRYRLLTFDHDPQLRAATVEIAHEALIRRWERLRGWLQANREDLRTHRRLIAASEEWLAAGKDPSFLARGSRLEQLEIWHAGTDLTLTASESEYLQASIDERETHRAQEQARREREKALEKRSRDVLRALVGVMAVATLIALILAGVAISQSEEARLARAAAEHNEQVAQHSAAETNSLALAANARNALIEHDPTLALRLALEANRAFQPAPVEVLRVLAAAAYGPGIGQRFEGHTAAVLTVAFSPDQTMSASAGADGTIRLWDNRTGEAIRQIELSGQIITGVAFSPEGTHLLAATTDHNLYLFDTQTGEELRSLTGHDDMVTDVVFSADGHRALSGSLDKTLRLWDVDSGEQLLRLEGHTGVILAVALSADGRIAASSAGDETIADTADDEIDRTVRIWDLNSGEALHTLEPEGGFVRTVAISPDGRSALTATWSAQGAVISLWDLDTGENVRNFFGHSDVITSIRFSPDGRTLLSASWDQTLRLWDINTGIELTRFESFQDHLLAIDISPDGQFILAASGNLGGNEIDIAFENSQDTSVWLVDLQNRDLVRTMTGHEDWPWTVALSPDGRTAASGSGPLRPPVIDSSIRLWNVASGEELLRLEAHTDTVESLAFSPDGNRLISVGWDGYVILWDATNGDEIRRFGESGPAHDERATAVAFHPDGSQAASGSSDGTIILWEVSTGTELRRFAGHETSVAGLVFTPDGMGLVSALWDQTLRLWDINSGQEIRRYEGHSDRVNAVAVHPDGDRLLSGSWDATVRLWDIDSGQEIRRFLGHNGPVQAVAFSHDGHLALSGSADTSMRLWDLATGQELQRFDDHTDWVSGVVFTPDDHYAISSAQDNRLRLWRVAGSAEEIAAWALTNRYVRELTCAEREQYRVEPLCE